MVPSAFVTLEALPLTANGKVDRKALPASQLARRATVVEPRTRVEMQLLNIWQRALERTDFGVRDNFFELGGHSLLAVRLFALIERVFGRRLPVSALFQAPTIERLGQRLEREGFKSPWIRWWRFSRKARVRRCSWCQALEAMSIWLCRSRAAARQGAAGLRVAVPRTGRPRAAFRQLQPMAAHYVQEIRKAQPHGPYYLGGACSGAP